MTTLSFSCHLQRDLSQIIQKQKHLSEKLQDETDQKEQLRKQKNEMEKERWHLDQTIEKLQKEVREQEVGHVGGPPLQTPLPLGLMKARETCCSS